MCVVTNLVNCQVIEKSDANEILDGITRLGCEAISEVEVTLPNLKLQVMQEKGITMEVCSVGGHNEHGLVERVFSSLQDSLHECGVANNHFTATGFQTLCKLVENDYNNLHIGFKYDRDQDNTKTLKNMRLGRINTRDLSDSLFS